MDNDKQINQHSNVRWDKHKLQSLAKIWHKKMRKKYSAASEKSPWWIFIPDWHKHIDQWIDNFCAGKHQFTPMKN